ncbi:Cobalt-zinc-cadmium resistance protein CzcA [Labilithrix luteola]|uniref:Cobalt-zinc-cadmium resistance protein CzcA n=1 Tax=Labilithrix luteola TaxID=1391654 RepID=A0A0K1QCZ8_9BACT|nr:multidrug efflux RND transporter permease subunit [Labilithrix luteola]AKV03603.1 Cobalt-zinc-cadmium resistance protein CzcA [Labilithrix luteola]
MNLSAPFVRRPIATALLSAAILLAGMLAFTLLPVAPLPRVDFPTVQISASLPGASPETMASAVATPLERRFGRIAGVSEITSTSSLGTTNITIQFALDRDVESAARDVQAAINAAGGELPADMPARPFYRKVNPADAPIMILSLTSKTIPIAQVSDAATTILSQRIAQVSGVGQVFVGGSAQPAVRVRVDPANLAGLGLTMADVRTALATSTVDGPKGNLQGDTQSHTLSANDQLIGAKAFGDVIVASRGDSVVHLRDIARVDDSVENERIAAWTNGVPAVLIIIRRQPGANIVETNDRIKAVLPELATSISPAINVEVALDRTQSVRASVEDVERTLVISLILVVLVVFMFLRSARATAIPSVAVPMSLIGTFGIMYLLGYSLDNLSLMALTIATGFVVDDAIVVTENVTRYIELGKPPLEAALEGAKQIGFTIVSITVSLLAVFIPILLMGGIVGRLFREFAVTLSISIAVSAVVSLTLTPMMCARLLVHDPGKHGRLYMASERVFEFILRVYGAGLSWVIRRRTFVGVLTLATIALTVALYAYVPKGLFPQQDVGMLMGFTEAPQDVSYPAMTKRQERATQIVMADPDIAHVVAFIGAGPGGGTVNTGSMFIELKRGKRAPADEIINRLRPKLAQLEGLTVYLQAVQDVRVGGRAARTQYQYTLQDANLEELREWGPKVLERLRKIPLIKDVNTDQQTAGLELAMNVDRDTASRLGVTMQQIDDSLYDAFGQRQVAITYATMNQYRVVLEAKPDLVVGPDAVEQVYVKTASGGVAPIRSFIKPKAGATALSIGHQGQFPATTISFNLAPGRSLGEAIAAIHEAEAEIGMPASIRADFQGTAQAFTSSLKSEPYLVLAALVTVYLVLGILYESLIHPITILSTLPSAGVGALLALLLTKTEFSIIALIGIILLIGIVKKNAIMMIDFAIEAEREEGLSPEQAITQACLLRFRPIVMTTLAALLGAVPLAIGQGVGSELRRPLGIAIIGGLIFSQALTLYTTPVIYLALDKLTKRRREAAKTAHA